MQIETLLAEHNLCGEGPVWDDSEKRLIWNDCSSSLVFDYFPNTGARRVLSERLMAAGIALNVDGRLVFSGATGVHLWRGPNDYITLASEHEGEKLSCNDIIADPFGRLYFATVYWGPEGMQKHGKLYTLDPGGAVRIADEGIELANGLGFSPDGRVLYFADTTVRRIYAYDVDLASGTLSKKRILVQIPRSEGMPDGLTVDADGFVWSAHWYGGEVVRYDPDGKVERRIAMPALQVSSVAFGGDDLTDLYVTSAAESWQSHYAPPGYDFDAANIGGSLFRVRLNIAGRLEHRARM
jgi:sugar lactone lactonase YvrE